MNMTMGRKLYLLRSRLNLTLEQAADIIGVSKSTLCRYEKDECICRSEEIRQRICRLYQVHPGYFREDMDIPETEAEIWGTEELLQAWESAGTRTRIRVMRILQDQKK